MDLAILALCNASIIGIIHLKKNWWFSRLLVFIWIQNVVLMIFKIMAPLLVFILKQCFSDDFQDYGTFGVWGALLAGGETIVSNKTFRQIQILNLYSYFTSTQKNTFFQHYVCMPRNYPFQFWSVNVNTSNINVYSRARTALPPLTQKWFFRQIRDVRWAADYMGWTYLWTSAWLMWPLEP